MKTLTTFLAASVLLAAPALACEAHVAEIRAAAPAVSAAIREQGALDARYRFAMEELFWIEEELYYEGEYAGWQEEMSYYEAEAAAAQKAYQEKQGAWSASGAVLEAAIAAHQAACGANARTAAVLSEFDITLNP